jgi:hypothetical protein
MLNLRQDETAGRAIADGAAIVKLVVAGMEGAMALVKGTGLR